MNDNRHDERAPSAGADDRAPTAPGPDTREPRMASRRYMLLKGATRGAAILAAATPIKTLASIPSVTSKVDGLLCTISGTQSGVVSASTGLPTCGGRTPEYYKIFSHWPASAGLQETTTFNELFDTSSDSGEATLLHILNNRPNGNKIHWITAYLNATAGTSGGYVFPYAPGEVLGLFKSPQKADALAFFKGFTETLASL